MHGSLCYFTRRRFQRGQDGVVSALRHDVRCLPAGGSDDSARTLRCAALRWPNPGISAKALQHLPLEFAHRSISTTLDSPSVTTPSDFRSLQTGQPQHNDEENQKYVLPPPTTHANFATTYHIRATRQPITARIFGRNANNILQRSESPVNTVPGTDAPSYMLDILSGPWT